MAIVAALFFIVSILLHEFGSSLGAAAAHEPTLQPSIAVVEDPALGVSGPLWVRGGIPIESAADGHVYERRNRVTLCRCGQSRNKPFYDGTHAAIAFRDGSPDVAAQA